MSGQDQTTNADVVLSANVDGYTAPITQATQQTNVLAAAVDTLSAKLDGLQKRAGKKLLSFAAGGAAGFAAATADAAVFEKQLGGLQATAAVTGQRFDKLKGTVKSLTEQFPVSRGQAIQLVATIEDLGVTSEKSVNKLAATFTKLGGATGESMTQLASGLTELNRQMGTLDAGTLDRYANSLLVVSKNAGVSSTGVLAFASSIAPAARAAGIGEAATLGISAAFQKAGQSGYYAANAFNSMLNEINQMISSGSPEIAKYANLIGKSASEFRSMFANGQGAEAITEIFDAIQKQGQGAVQTLDRLGFDGVRALQSFQALSQSGGLRKAIAEATGATTNTDALDKGSKAAFSGFLDTLQQTKSTLADIGDDIGSKLLPPLDAMAHGFNTVVQAAKPLIELVTLLGGGVATLGAAAVGGTLFLGGKLASVAALGAFTKGVGIKGYREGRAQGRVLAGVTDAAAGEEAANYAASRMGQMNYLGRFGYEQGLKAGVNYDPDRGHGVGSRLAAGTRMFRNLVDDSTSFYRNARRYEVDGPLSRSSRGLAALLHPVTFARGIAAGGEGSGFDATATESSANLGKALRASVESATKQAAATVKVNSAMGSLAAETGALTRSFVRLAAAQTGAGVRTLAGGVGSLAGRLGGGLLNLAGGPVGLALMGLSIGVPMALNAKNAADAAKSTNEEDLLPINKYNAALDIASSSLASFTDSVNAATKALPAPNSMAQAATLSADAIGLASTPGRKLTNAAAKSYRGQAAQVAYLQSLGITDPKQLQLAGVDLLQVNNGNVQATDKVLQAYLAKQGGPTDFGAIFASADAKQMRGAFATHSSAEANSQIEQALGSIQSQRVADMAKGSKYANQRTTDSLRSYFGALLDPKRLNSATGYQTAIQGVSQFENQFLGGKQTGFDPTDFAYKMQHALGSNASADARGKYFLDQLIGSGNKGIQSQAQTFLGGANFNGISSDALATLAVTATDGTNRRIANTSALGGRELNSRLAQNFALHPADYGNQSAAIDEMVKNAKAMGGSLTGANDALERLITTIGDASNPMSQLASAAQQFVAASQAAAMSGMSRAQRGATVQYNLRTALAADPNDPNFQQNKNAALAGAEQEKESDRNFFAQIVQMQKDFAISRTRADQDYFKSTSRASDDFHHSMYIRTRDFNLQMTRMAEDAAKSMYNPYQRVFGKATADVGTLTFNLQDQNRRMQQQVKQLSQVRKMGLSADSIKQLDLANPENAQQLTRLVDDLSRDPKQAARINALVMTRMQASKSLATNQYNVAYTRAQQDFATANADAKYSFDLSLKRNAADYQTAVKRQKEDLARFGEEVVGDLGDVYNQAVKLVDKNMGSAGAALLNRMNDIKKQASGLFQDIYSINTSLFNFSAAMQNAYSSQGLADPQTFDSIMMVAAKQAASQVGPKAQAQSTSGAKSVTNYNGAITVQSQNPDEFAAKLATKQRLSNLARAGQM